MVLMIDPDEIHLDDEKTYELFQRVKLMVFSSLNRLECKRTYAL